MIQGFGPNESDQITIIRDNAWLIIRNGMAESNIRIDEIAAFSTAPQGFIFALRKGDSLAVFCDDPHKALEHVQLISRYLRGN